MPALLKKYAKDKSLIDFLHRTHSSQGTGKNMAMIKRCHKFFNFLKVGRTWTFLFFPEFPKSWYNLSRISEKLI